MFLAAFFSFVLWTLVFLRLRGNVVPNGRFFSFRKTSEAGVNWRGKVADDPAMAIARQMLL